MGTDVVKGDSVSGARVSRSKKARPVDLRTDSENTRSRGLQAARRIN